MRKTALSSSPPVRGRLMPRLASRAVDIAVVALILTVLV
jgi:hypothetical protein